MTVSPKASLVKTFAITCSLLVGGALPSTAENYIFVQGAVTAPLTKVDFQGTGVSQSVGGVGPGGGAQFLYVDDREHRWGLGLDVLEHGFASSSASNVIPATRSSFSLNTVSILAIGRLNLWTMNRFRPYLLIGLAGNIRLKSIFRRKASHFFVRSPTIEMLFVSAGSPILPVPSEDLGLGAAQNHFRWDVTPTAGNVWQDTGTSESRRLTDSSSTGFSSAFGLGVDHALTGNWFLGAEFRLTEIGKTSYRPTPGGQSLGVGNFSGSLGIVSGLIHVGYRIGSSTSTPVVVKGVEHRETPIAPPFSPTATPPMPSVFHQSYKIPFNPWTLLPSPSEIQQKVMTENRQTIGRRF